MTRNKSALASFLATAQGALLIVAPVHAAPTSQQRLEQLLTHNADAAQSAEFLAMVQATDGYISTSRAVEKLLTHTGTAWSADHLAMVQATDGYNAVTLEQLLTHNDSASPARIADGVKAQKKMAASFNNGFADRLLWTDGYISLP